MHRKSLLISLVCIYLATIGGIMAWSALGFLGAAGTAFAQVKGSSSDAALISVTPPALAAYSSVNTQAVPQIPAMQFALYAAESGQIILRSKNLDSVPIASTTKLMSSHLVSKFGKLDDVTTVSDTASSVEGSLAHVQSGERISIKNLLYCLLLVSGNDAAHALAEYTGGILLGNPTASAAAKTARFVQAMNEEALRLHMEHTHYMDPAGLNDDGHSNAIDLAKIASVNIADANLQPIMDTADSTVSDQSGQITHKLHNSDRLVSDYQYAGSLGGKTGFTPAAGHCIVSSAKRSGHTLIAVILNTDSSAADASAQAVMKLLDWGFSNVSWQ